MEVCSKQTKLPKMVAFFGPDGAGKSTQAQLLVEYYKSKGCKVKKAWVRSIHTLAFLIWNIFRKLRLCYNRSNIPLQSLKKPAVSYLREDSYGAISPISMMPPILKGTISRLLWILIEIISVIPIILLQVYIPLFLGYHIVAERYVVDTVVTISYFINDPSFIKSRFATLLLKFIPKRSKFIFVDANYKVILSRRGRLAGPFEYTEFHRKGYFELGRAMGSFYVNTSDLSIEEAHKKIIEYLRN